MKTRFSIILLIVIFVAACGNKKPADDFPSNSYEGLGEKSATQTNDGSNDEGILFLKKLSYEFHANQGADTCSTGFKKFKNTHELCITLLDDDANQHCADQKRHDAFFRACGAIGYLPQDGLQCKFGFLKPDAILGALSPQTETCYEQLQAKDMSEMREECIGRHAGEADVGSRPTDILWNYLGPLKITGDSAYLYPNQITQKQTTHLKVHFETSVESADFEFKAGLILKTGCQLRQLKSNDRLFQVFAACKPVHGCK
jgi:hypothetical protein